MLGFRNCACKIIGQSSFHRTILFDECVSYVDWAVKKHNIKILVTENLCDWWKDLRYTEMTRIGCSISVNEVIKHFQFDKPIDKRNRWFHLLKNYVLLMLSRSLRKLYFNIVRHFCFKVMMFKFSSVTIYWICGGDGNAQEIGWLILPISHLPIYIIKTLLSIGFNAQLFLL